MCQVWEWFYQGRLWTCRSLYLWQAVSYQGVLYVELQYHPHLHPQSTLSPHLHHNSQYHPHPLPLYPETNNFTAYASPSTPKPAVSPPSVIVHCYLIPVYSTTTYIQDRTPSSSLSANMTPMSNCSHRGVRRWLTITTYSESPLSVWPKYTPNHIQEVAIYLRDKWTFVRLLVTSALEWQALAPVTLCRPPILRVVIERNATHLSLHGSPNTICNIILHTLTGLKVPS